MVFMFWIRIGIRRISSPLPSQGMFVGISAGAGICVGAPINSWRICYIIASVIETYGGSARDTSISIPLDMALRNMSNWVQLRAMLDTAILDTILSLPSLGLDLLLQLSLFLVLVLFLLLVDPMSCLLTSLIPLIMIIAALLALRDYIPPRRTKILG
jgi:hypothetical protein